MHACMHYVIKHLVIGVIAISAGYRLHISIRRCNLCVQLIERCNPSPVPCVLDSVQAHIEYKMRIKSLNILNIAILADMHYKYVIDASQISDVGTTCVRLVEWSSAGAASSRFNTQVALTN